MRHASKIVRTFSDMGSIKVFSPTLSCFFDNGIGDGGNIVKIYAKQLTGDSDKVLRRDAKFLGHFTVRKNNEVQLAEYDCTDEAMYKFKKGRWFVYLEKPAHFAIVLNDTDEDSLEA